MLIEIHILQNHAPANLNRDETGSPKACIFGGVQRARISSQAIKRSIRRSDLFDQAVGTTGIRTRQLPEKVRQAFLDAGRPADIAEAAALRASGFGKADGKAEKANKHGEILTAQTMFLSDADIAAVTAAMLQACEGKSVKDIEKLDVAKMQDGLAGFRPITPDIALFGRMITSKSFRDVEAAIQTAHAISTHRVEPQFDFFTAVDDLLDRSVGEEADAGADMMGDVEFNSATFYKYFSIDVDGLIANLTGERVGRAPTTVSETERAEARRVAGTLMEAFLRAACSVSPTGKQNTFAAHNWPALVLVEARPHATPVSYANAFVNPVRLDREAGGLVSTSIDALAKHVTALTEAYGLESVARWLLVPEHPVAIPGVERVTSLGDLAGRVGQLAHHG